MSLLELLLALALAGLVMYAVAMAIDLHLRALDVRRTSVEEAQVARAVLQMIANDLRGTVREYKVDMSSVEQLAMASLAGAGTEALDALTGGAASGSSGAGGTTSGQTGNATSGGGGTSSSGGATPGAGGSSGAASGAGSTSGGTTGDASTMVSEDGSTANTQDLSSSTSLPPVPGLYGNQYQLQIDVSRLPRIDQYQTILDPNNVTLARIPSDVKTITYFIQTPTIGGGMITDPLAYRSQSSQPAIGLIRREVDRSVMEYALTSGGTDALMRTGDLLAPEITDIQFQYFDGLTWYTSWDSEQMEGLPVAVDIVVAIMPRDSAQRTSILAPTAMTAVTPIIYRLTVHLPLGAPPPADEMADDGLQNLGL